VAISAALPLEVIPSASGSRL